MKSSKRSWNTALWLIAISAIILSFNFTPVTVQAGPAPDASPATVATPLDAAAILAATTPLDTTMPPVRRSQQTINLPSVEEFILTPPNPAANVYKTRLSLRFAESAAERLPAAVPTTLGDQQVVLQRSADDPSVYSAVVDFNWNEFAEEQARRQELASEGTMIPAFEGHRLQAMQPMQFIDPAEIRQALQSHQSIRFTPLVLQGNPLSIVPDHELIVNAVSVVEDPSRTWDPCSSTGRKMGPWTFGAIMTAIANDNPSTHLVADQMVQSWLNLWSNTQTVNHFPVTARLGILGVLRRWRGFAQDQNNNVDISQAPFQLNAIVNRIDLTSAGTPSGELRFVFGYAPCNGNEGLPAAFNVIVEFRVPVAQCGWATQWHSLDILPGPRFNNALQAITDQVTTNASQNLDQVRTNEAFTSGGGVWEQKQFVLSSATLIEIPVPQSPNGDNALTGRVDFNQFTCQPFSNCQAGVLTNYINTFQQDILNNDYNVPLNFPGSSPFLGGSTLNGPFSSLRHDLVYWQGNPAPNSNQARSIFSENTCNGCHGRETFVEFQQVENRQPGPISSALPSALSAFLVGCSTSSQQNPLTDQTGPCADPPTNACNLQNTLTRSPACASWVQDPGDPSGQTVHQFAEVARRAQNLSTILQGCRSDGLLQSLAVQRLSSPH